MQNGKELTEDELAKINPLLNHPGNKSKSYKAQKKARKEYQAKLKKAPRRGKDAPIGVALLKVEVLDGKSRKYKFDPKIDSHWRKLFTQFKNYRYTDERKMRSYVKKRQDEMDGKIRKSGFGRRSISKADNNWYNKAIRSRVPGEVYVHLTMKSDGFVGYNKRTKKFGAGTKLILIAKISGTYLPKEYIVKEDIYNILRNEKHFINLSKKIQRVIDKKVRKDLPSIAWVEKNHRSIASSSDKRIAKKKKAIKNYFKNMFKR
jgi:hypothetical protein